MRKRVLHIISNLHPWGGARQLSLLAPALPRDEFDVHICTFEGGGSLAEDLRRQGIPVTSLDKRGPVDPWAFSRLRRLLRSFRPDLVHTWHADANLHGRMAAVLFRSGPIVATERFSDRPYPVGGRTLNRVLARFTRQVIVQHPLLDRHCRRHGTPVDQTLFVPKGAPEMSAPAAESRTALLQRLGIRHDSRLIGTVGPLTGAKRVKSLVWAADQTNLVSDREVHFLIMGDGPQRRLLQRYAHLYQVAERVHFLGARDDVAAWLPHLDVFLLAGLQEGHSTPMLEAMSAGVPVVALDSPGHRTLIESGLNGFLIPRGIRSAFARYIDKILMDPALAERLATAGRSKAAEFTVERMAQAHVEIYRNVLGR